MTSRAATYLRPHLVLMLVLFVGAAIAGFVLLPGDAERVAMLERDGNNVRAQELLERRYAKGDRSQRTLYQLEQLYQHFGDLPKARQMLELLAAGRPNDIVLQRRLVRFYRDTQDGEAYLAKLSRLVSRKYSEPVCRELIAQLRLVGQYTREREAIERCRLKGYRREGDIVRLAQLEAVSGDNKKALALLRNVDDVKGIATQRERLMLTSLLIDAGEDQEVARRAGQWLKHDPEERFSIALMEFLSERQEQEVAMQIARDLGKPGDGLSLSVAELMIDRDQISAARAYLRGWVERAELTDTSLASRVISTALDAEDPEVALLAAQRVGMTNVAETDLVRIAEALGATGRRAEFETVRVALSSDTLVAHPLLSAMVELNKGSADATRELLDKVPSDALDTWRLALWARLMRETGKAAVADARLRELGVTTAMPPVRAKKRVRARQLARTIERRQNRVAGQHASATGDVPRVTQSRTSRSARAQRIKRLRKLEIVRRAKFKQDNRSIERPKPIVRPLALNEKKQ